MGEVVEAGGKVKNLKVGDRVVVPFTCSADPPVDLTRFRGHPRSDATGGFLPVPPWLAAELKRRAAEAALARK